MVYNYCSLFIIFFVYSIIGYLAEVTSVSLNKKRLVLSRGFLIGPYIPIFGVGGIFMSLLLNKYRNDIVALFFLGMILGLTVEYFGSLIMEKIFKLRWWDYSNDKFNINGRICLQTGVEFGIAAVLVINFLYPFLDKIIISISSNAVIILGVVLSIIFFSDVVLSNIIMFKLKHNVCNYNKVDATEEIKKLIREELSKKNVFMARLIKAFPDAKGVHFTGLKEWVLKITK